MSCTILYASDPAAAATADREFNQNNNGNRNVATVLNFTNSEITPLALVRLWEFEPTTQ